MFGRWWRGAASRGRAAPSEPLDVASVLASGFAWWPMLDADERRRIVVSTEHLVAALRFEAAQGFTLTDAMRVLVSAQGALMLLGLDDDGALDGAGPVIVHRADVWRSGERAVGGSVMSRDPVLLAGEAHHRGPIVIAWRSAQRDLRRLGSGRNVVVHELAHALDMLDHVLDGTPPLGGDDDLRRRWVEVCAVELAGVRRADPGPLRAYAALNPAEFFAVASEVFFDRPLALATERPALYEVLVRFYGQDPAARLAGYEASVSAATAVDSATGR